MAAKNVYGFVYFCPVVLESENRTTNISSREAKLQIF